MVCEPASTNIFIKFLPKKLKPSLPQFTNSYIQLKLVSVLDPKAIGLVENNVTKIRIVYVVAIIVVI